MAVGSAAEAKGARPENAELVRESSSVTCDDQDDRLESCIRHLESRIYYLFPVHLNFRGVEEAATVRPERPPAESVSESRNATANAVLLLYVQYTCAGLALLGRLMSRCRAWPDHRLTIR